MYDELTRWRVDWYPYL